MNIRLSLEVLECGDAITEVVLSALRTEDGVAPRTANLEADVLSLSIRVLGTRD
jgi:hypothetical protein